MRYAAESLASAGCGLSDLLLAEREERMFTTIATALSG